jgi:hypothetical protein
MTEWSDPGFKSRIAHRAAFPRHRVTLVNRSLVFDLAACAGIGKREDALFMGPSGTLKSQLAQAIGQSAIQQDYRAMYKETHVCSSSPTSQCAS